MTIIVCMPVTDEHKNWLAEAAGKDELIFCEQDSIPAEALARAEVIIGNPPVDCLKNANSLRLLQINSAGTGPYPALEKMQPQAALCCATGSYGLAISEHMIGSLLMMMKNLSFYRDQQFEGKWESHGFVDAISGSRVLALGMGDIGSAFAERMHALGATVVGVRRNTAEVPPYCEAVYPVEKLDEILPQFDIIGMSMPETPETIGMMNEKRFSLMKDGVYLVNVGRGSAIDQDALLSALRSGKVKGASLDVTTPEPLPADHPLWQEPRCVITPHISGGYRLPATHSKIIRLACRNLNALREGKPLESQVDYATTYSRRKG